MDRKETNKIIVAHNIANNLPIQVNDRATELELLYIDDLVEEMLDALEGKEHHCEYQECADCTSAIDTCHSLCKSHCRSRSRNSCIAACDHKYRLSDPIGLYYQLWFDCRPWMCDRRRRTYFSGDCDQGRKSDSKSNKN